MNIKKITKSLLCIAAAAAMTFSLVSCGAEKNVVSEGLEQFEKISDKEIINDKELTITKSEDGAKTSYKYIFQGEDGQTPILLMASADSKTKELIDVSLSFFGTGRKDGGAIPDSLKNRFADLALSSMQSFASLGESEAKAILEELRAYDTDFYNGKNSSTKTVGSFRYSLGSSLIATAFTIVNPAYDNAESSTAQ